MILLIAGTSHTGKTLLAQRLMERHHWPYLSIDHLKMGLIRSGMLPMSPCNDDALTPVLWPVLREIIKTAVENSQNLIIEGCYVPFDWQDSFDGDYLPHIRALWLIMTRAYIEEHFGDIRQHASDIESRGEDEGLTADWLIRDNERNLAECQRHGCPYLLIDGTYQVDWQP
ncbi:MAG: adenylate kinase [Christensenellaceae bacterium]|nr:adenylate kinase [Christensenellaceae bacterium]